MNRSVSVPIVFVASLLVSVGLCQTASPRRYVPLTTEWTFHKGDVPGAEKMTFDDSRWRTVTVPHDWSIEGPYSEQWASGTGYLPGGIGWYRNTFQLDADADGKSVYVEFDGVYCNSEVWINDHYLGKRPYGYISFYYDLTPHIRYNGDENILAVRVDHSDYADSRWYTGSGIYRPVRLCITDKVRIATWGVYVTTPKVTAEQAEIRIETTLDNLDAAQSQIDLTSYIINPDNLVVAKVSHSGGVVEAQGLKTYVQTATIRDPQLWSIQTPTMYSVLSVLETDGRIIDQVRTPFGIRTFRFDPDEGFFLNDEHVTLKGVCVHHDAGPVGAAVPSGMWRRRLEMLKEIGCNAIRMSHNPPAKELLDLCDQMGFLVMNEAFDEFTPPKRKWVEGWNAGTPSLKGYGQVFEQWAVRDIQDWVRRDRNHPSIIFWSIGNEIDYPNDPFSHPVLGNEYKPTQPPADDLVRYGKPLVEAVKELDTTRPVTAALASVAMSDAVGFTDLLDVVGYNYQEQRYVDDHAKHPKRVIYGSENGKHYGAWQAVTDNDFISGQFLWVGFDFLGEARGWPVRNSQAGLFDLCGFKKPIGWFRQALWAPAPMIYLAASPRRDGSGSARRNLERGMRSHWNWPEQQRMSVIAYSNCPQAELFLNGRSLGQGTPMPQMGPVFVWDVPFSAGELKAVGQKDGGAVCEYSLNTAGEPQRIHLKPDTRSLKADGQDVCQIEFYIADDKGVRVPDAENLVRFHVSGPARILAVGNGDPANHADETDAVHNAWQGRGLAIVQALYESGTVRVSASSPDLDGTEVQIEIK